MLCLVGDAGDLEWAGCGGDVREPLGLDML